ncbi:MAG: hypothetical protein LBU19_11205 [Treponema sp.]|jgi:hypothetical protein|nr:hypothetical protein [Treponema sp.]
MTRLYTNVTMMGFIIAVFSVISGPALGAQPLRNGEASSVQAANTAAAEGTIPLRRITIYSSGVSFFEHSRTLTGPAVLKLPFKASALNDALKSLLLNDPASAFPLISYSSERSLPETLRSLGIDLSGNPGMAEILGNLRGEELEVFAPGPIRGRITAVEYRQAGEFGAAKAEPWLSLLTPQGIRLLSLAEIGSLRFTSDSLNADLGRALDLLMVSRNSQTRELAITLPGGGSRPVSVSYVIPSPVWKVSYRLDLGDPARFQGWAIVDNDNDEDWRNVELSLTAGRPASFIQELYPPYYLSRPTLPLAIAGSAAPLVWDSVLYAEESAEYEPPRARAAAAAGAPAQKVPAPSPPPVTGADMADQFSFTLNSPVNLDRRTSAMFPLSDGEIVARKFLIFSGTQAGRAVHPSVGAELNNTTGLKLPAGPVTVYDGGFYAGDALLEFLNLGEKRLISWGEDLSVTGTSSVSSARTVTAVNVSGGVMTISRRQAYERKYHFKNTGPEAKTIFIEHPITMDAVLAEPKNYEEATAAAYRFIRELRAAGEMEFLVREERPLSEQISLLSLRPETLLSYSTSQEIPANVRASLREAVELKRRAEDAEKAKAETGERRNAQAAEQDRIRKNLEAAGSGTQQGQEYLRRLTSLDVEIDRLNGELEDRQGEVQAAQAAYEDYLRKLRF